MVGPLVFMGHFASRSDLRKSSGQLQNLLLNVMGRQQCGQMLITIVLLTVSEFACV